MQLNRDEVLAIGLNLETLYYESDERLDVYNLKSKSSQDIKCPDQPAILVQGSEKRHQAALMVAFWRLINNS